MTLRLVPPDRAAGPRSEDDGPEDIDGGQAGFQRGWTGRGRVGGHSVLPHSALQGRRWVTDEIRGTPRGAMLRCREGGRASVRRQRESRGSVQSACPSNPIRIAASKPGCSIDEWVTVRRDSRGDNVPVYCVLTAYDLDLRTGRVMLAP